MTVHMKAICPSPIFLLLVLLTGCFSLGRDEPPQRHYVLGASGLQEGGDPAEGPAGLTIGLRQLQLAGYLESPFIVVRHGPHQIRFSEFHRWGEEISQGMSRTIASYLAADPRVNVVNAAPWAPRAEHDYLIELHVSRFEGVASEAPEGSAGEVHLLASWEIIRPQDGAVLERGTTDHRAGGWTVGDYDGLVTLLDAGLRELSNDLISGLNQIAAP